MTVREVVSQVLEGLSEERQQRLLDYALFLQEQEEKAEWQRFGQVQLARAYGNDEPEYTEADVKPAPSIGYN